MLLTKGRLSLAQLARISELKLRTIRVAILVLVQHNILWHAKSDDELEMFEINADECLMRLRFGRFVWLSEQIFGQTVRYVLLQTYPNLMFAGLRDNSNYLGPRKTSVRRYPLFINSP